MKRLVYPIAMAGYLLFQACQPADKPVQPSATFKVARLLANKHRPQALITTAAIGAIAAVSPNKIIIQPENNDSLTGQGTVTFSWPAGDQITVGSQYVIDRYHAIGITSIGPCNLAQFNDRYRGNHFLQLAIDEKGKDSSLPADIAIAEIKYWAHYAKTCQLEKVNQVGDAAYWEMPMQALHVLVHDVAFTITTNVGHNEVQSREMAIQLVHALFNNP